MTTPRNLAYLVEVIYTCARRKVYNEMRRLLFLRLVRYNSHQLRQFFRCSAVDEEIRQADTNELDKDSSRVGTYLAGVLLSSTTALFSSVRFFSIFFACTLTTIRAGFRRPTLTSSERASASVIVALKRPVLLCLGRCVMIRVKVV